jgi:hypothetical protein
MNNEYERTKKFFFIVAKIYGSTLFEDKQQR